MNESGRIIEDYGCGALVTLTRTDQLLELQLAGGAGYGPPLARPAGEVEHDLRAGYITPEAAARDYGAVLTPDGRLDLAATAAHRAERAAHPPAAPDPPA